jgi:RNA-directed DNA polymerase
MGTWLRAGGRAAGVLHHPDTGVGQGGTLAPVLAHLVLQQVLEAWCAQEVPPRLQGRRVLSRCADDCVLGGALAAAARKSMAVLPKRFARYGVTSHPTKTAVMAFGPPAGRSGADPRNRTGDCLGVTPDGTTSRRGGWVSKRRTARKRLRRTKQSGWRWCRANRHAPVKDPYQRLCRKVRGHVQYYGLQGNCRVREEVRRSAEQAGRYWLSRRSSQRALGWEQCQQLRETSVLPTPRIVHTI